MGCGASAYNDEVRRQATAAPAAAWPQQEESWRAHANKSFLRELEPTQEVPDTRDETPRPPTAASLGWQDLEKATENWDMCTYLAARKRLEVISPSTSSEARADTLKAIHAAALILIDTAVERNSAMFLIDALREAKAAGLSSKDLEDAEEALEKRARVIEDMGSKYTGLASIAEALRCAASPPLQGSLLGEGDGALPRRQDLPSGALRAAADLLPKLARRTHSDRERLLWLSDVITMWASAGCSSYCSAGQLTS